MHERNERPQILCVDDDDDIQVLVARLLGHAGYEVTGAGDATQALLAIQTVNPDLILLDVRMPGMDGYALCAQLQSDPATAHIPIIFETSLGDERSKARAFAAGVHIVSMTNNILEVAVSERTSDIHIEPHETNTVARFRVDGDLHEYFRMPKDTGARVVSRVKVLAELDIAEKRLPQDGAFSVSINNRDFNMRVATTSTPYGEAATIRLLEPYTKPRALSMPPADVYQAVLRDALAQRTSEPANGSGGNP